MSHSLKAKVEKIIHLVWQIGHRGIISSQAVGYGAHTLPFRLYPRLDLLPNCLSISLFLYLRHTHTHTHPIRMMNVWCNLRLLSVLRLTPTNGDNRWVSLFQQWWFVYVSVIEWVRKRARVCIFALDHSDTWLICSWHVTNEHAHTRDLLSQKH